MTEEEAEKQAETVLAFHKKLLGEMSEEAATSLTIVWMQLLNAPRQQKAWGMEIPK